MDNKKGHIANNIDPHKEAMFSTWYFHQEFASQELGAMQFYEKYLNDVDRALCEKAIKEIMMCRDKFIEEK